MSDDPTYVEYWTAQVNDLVGGWIVTNYPAPLSQHDLRPNGDPAKRGYVIASFMAEHDARTIALYLNDNFERRSF